MKKLTLLAMLCIAVASIKAQNGMIFEFKISSTKGATGTIKSFYSPAGSRMEMQVAAPQMPNGGFSKTTIIKSDSPTTVFMLNEKDKTYTTSEVPQQSNTTENTSDYTVKIIGKEKVGNYNCTHAVVTKGTESNDYWTTTEITEYEKYSKSKGTNKFMGSSNEYDALVKNGAAGFVVKSIVRDPRGGDFTMELVKMEKKDLAAGMFAVPADYKASTTAASVPGMPNIDVNKIQNMTPEERAKYVEDMKKQYGTKGGN